MEKKQFTTFISEFFLVIGAKVVIIIGLYKRDDEMASPCKLVTRQK